MSDLQLDKLTDEMFELIEKETGATKKEVLQVEENEELRQKIIEVIGWIEVDELYKCTKENYPEKFSKLGRMATDIVTYLCYKPPLDDYYDDSEDEEPEDDR